MSVLAWPAGRQRPPRPVIYVCLALALVILGFEVQALLPRAAAPADDFAAYWAVGRLAAQSRNPYSPQEVLTLEQAAGWPLPEPLMVWYPPWALVVLMPFGLLPYTAGRLIWLVASVALFAACAAWLWRLYGGPAQRSLLALALVGSCAPALFVLAEGQISVLMLLGLTGFLYFQGRDRWFAAGACLALVALKPQLPCLLWLAVLLWAVDRRRWALVPGALTAVALATVPALLLNPAIFGQYLYTTGHYPPDGSNTATLGALLQLALGRPVPALQFAALMPGAAWLAWHSARQRRAWDWAAQLPLLLPAALVTAPFAWMHDQSLLLVTVIAVAARRSHVPAPAWALYIAANALALAMLPHWRFAQAWYSLWPLAGSLVCLAYARRRRRGPALDALAPAEP